MRIGFFAMRSAIISLVAVAAVLAGTQSSALILDSAAALDAVTLQQAQVRLIRALLRCS